MIDEDVEDLRAMIAMTDDDRSSDINIIHDTHNIIILIMVLTFQDFVKRFVLTNNQIPNLNFKLNCILLHTSSQHSVIQTILYESLQYLLCLCNLIKAL